MIEAARLAPSAKNRQPWKYIVYMEKSKAELLDVMEKALIKEQNEHALLPKSAWALPDAFHTLEIMRNAPAVSFIKVCKKFIYVMVSFDSRVFCNPFCLKHSRDGFFIWRAFCYFEGNSTLAQ